MRALDPEVGNAIWAAVEALLPKWFDAHPLGCHRPRASDRACFNVMLVRLTTGWSWDDAERLTGQVVSVHDRLAMYFNYDRATHAIRLAHCPRACRDRHQLGPGLGEPHGRIAHRDEQPAHTARNANKSHLPRRVLTGFLTRYNVLAPADLVANPQPLGRKRDTEKSIERLATC